MISAFRKTTVKGGLLAVAAATIFASCSTTKNLREGEQLFIGLEKIEYTNFAEDSIGKTEAEHFSTTKEEVESSLATAPNGALFGSSYYRTPLPYGCGYGTPFRARRTRLPNG